MLNIIKNFFTIDLKDLREPVILTPEAEQKIKNELGFIPSSMPDNNSVNPSGPRIMIKLFVEDDTFVTQDGRKTSIFKAPSDSHHEIMTTVTGIVVAMDSCCYQDKRFRLTGPYCRLGDWVTIPRGEGVIHYLKGKPVYILYDDRVTMVVSDPRIVRKD